MESKLRRAKFIFEKQGIVTLAKRIRQDVERTTKRLAREYSVPAEKHIQRLQEQEDLVIAEIGVAWGENAERLLSKLDVEEMYLIDPYEAYAEYDSDRSNIEEMRFAKKEAHQRLDSHANINWIEKFSDEAVTEIDRELDYVYIDGNHDYRFVKNDMENYYPLLKAGGILAGHDMDWSGVSQAFVEFAVENDLQPHLERYHPDWYFVKGQEM